MSTKTDLAEVRKHVRVLAEMGCAVVVFVPEELNGADPSKIEDRLIELGNDVIECLSGVEV